MQRFITHLVRFFSRLKVSYLQTEDLFFAWMAK